MRPKVNEAQKKALMQGLRTVKFFTGVGNNAAIAVMLDAHDQIKQHPYYGRSPVKYAYKLAIEAWHDYERRLRYESNSYFDTRILGEADRKRYGDISNDDYFELWRGMGAMAYQQTRPMVTSLWNKFRVSLIQHNVTHPELMAWPMAAQACLDIAHYLYTWAIADCAKQGIPKSWAEQAYNVFSIKRVGDAWRRAMKITDPYTAFYKLEPVEERNIQMGMEQLYEKWLNPDLLFESTISGIQDFDDVFRTKGEARKNVKEWKELFAEFHEALKEGYTESDQG